MSPLARQDGSHTHGLPHARPIFLDGVWAVTGHSKPSRSKGEPPIQMTSLYFVLRHQQFPLIGMNEPLGILEHVAQSLIVASRTQP